jgi:ubiquinone/menaquinone biosynthesis C-methylase UbiE
MALRVWPKESITAVAAQDRLRSSFLDTVKSYAKEKNVKRIESIIDVGCSVGISTFYLAKYYPEVKNILGLDLSPHFLSIAQYRQQAISSSGSSSGINSNGDDNDFQLNSYDDQFTSANIDRIQWTCQNAEKTDYPTGSFDLTAISFMFHELPQQASDDILCEMFRVTSSGGMIAITDNNPRSPVIQGK